MKLAVKLPEVVTMAQDQLVTGVPDIEHEVSAEESVPFTLTFVDRGPEGGIILILMRLVT